MRGGRHPTGAVLEFKTDLTRQGGVRLNSARLQWPLAPILSFAVPFFSSLSVFIYLLSGGEEQTARAISAYALCACLLSLQMGSVS